MVTAIAGLEEGIISGDTYVTCTGTYEYGGQTFRCNNHDTPMTLNVTDALKYSCNTFFYTVGQKLTGEHLEQWTKKFGLGTATGIEVGEATGQAAGPTYREQQRKADPAIREWQGGDDLNAAIGQSDNGFTPLQLANYVSAIVNGGTLYKPTLVKSIKSYDYSSFMKTDESEVLGKIDISDATRELVMQGMSEVTDEGGTAGSVFADYPIKVGGKTVRPRCSRTASRSTTVCSSRLRPLTTRRSLSAWSVKAQATALTLRRSCVICSMSISLSASRTAQPPVRQRTP